MQQTVMNALAELRAEKQRIEQAILVLENLSRGQGRRRGRPPAWMNGVVTSIDGTRKRAPFSEETKRKMAAAQKRRWAAHRKATASSTPKGEK